jgi:hypothetical protein
VITWLPDISARHFCAGPFIKLGPLRNIPGVAERAGCLSGAGLVVILTVALTIYGASAFQNDSGAIGVKTLSGRELQRDPLQVCAPPLTLTCIPLIFSNQMDEILYRMTCKTRMH